MIVLRSIVIVFTAIFLLLLVIQPLFRCWSLRHSIVTVLDGSKSVRVVEHSSRFDNHGRDQQSYREVIYSTVTLTPDQIKSIRRALPLSLDYSGFLSLACIFDEHHRIEIAQKDGKTFVLHICFHCGEIILNDEEHSRIMPIGWPSRLNAFMSSLGLKPNGPWQFAPRTAQAFMAIQTGHFTIAQILEQWGPPDRDIGSGVYIFEYDLIDGRKAVISTLDNKVLSGAGLYDPVTKRSELIYKHE